MAYSGIQQNVINKNTFRVKRYGHCDFESDPSFNPDTEQIVELNFIFDPSIWEYKWFWNGTTFEIGDPVPPKVYFCERDVPPSSTDDETLGYQRGCTWIDIANQRVYICIDNAEANAVWDETSNNGLLTFLKFYAIEDTSLSQTTGYRWVNKLSLEITALPSNITPYMLSWSAEISCSKNNRAVGIRVRQDGNGLGLGRITLPYSIDWLPTGGHALISWGGGDILIEMEYCLLRRNEPAEITAANIVSPYSISAKYKKDIKEKFPARARIRNARMVLWRVGP